MQRREYVRLQKLKRERQLRRAQTVPGESTSGGSTGELQVGIYLWSVCDNSTDSLDVKLTPKSAKNQNARKFQNFILKNKETNGTMQKYCQRGLI